MQSRVRSFVLSVLAMTLALPTVACDFETAPQALFIIGNAAPDESCTVKATGGASQVFLSQGILNLSVGTRYTAFMLVMNEFPTLDQVTSFESEDARMDSATVRITGMELSYRINSTLLNNAETIAALTANGVPATTNITLTRTASATVLPNGSAPVIADIIPSELGSALRAMPHIAAGGEAMVAIDVTLIGMRADDSVVRSAPWTFQVRLCNNCLVQHIFPENVARQPFRAEELMGEALDAKDIYGVGVCVPGADNFLPNAFCGAEWGPDLPTGAGTTCTLNRCLGSGALTCPGEDTVFYPAPG